MGSHGMKARTRQRRGLSEAVAVAMEAGDWHAAEPDTPRAERQFIDDLVAQLAARGLEVADIGGPWVDRSPEPAPDAWPQRLTVDDLHRMRDEQVGQGAALLGSVLDRIAGEPCQCGHPAVWHRWDGPTDERNLGRPYGPCEITGPQCSDGCDCQSFTPV